MTERIYQADSYCREAAARVTARERAGGRWRVRCDSTIFCPEGGGQPADRGTIAGLELLALESAGDDVVHVLGSDPGGGEVLLRLDFERRYDHMQQHTAQHLLSQVRVRDFQASTLSFAIGPEHSSIEVDRPSFGEEGAAVARWRSLAAQSYRGMGGERGARCLRPGAFAGFGVK